MSFTPASSGNQMTNSRFHSVGNSSRGRAVTKRSDWDSQPQQQQQQQRQKPWNRPQNQQRNWDSSSSCSNSTSDSAELPEAEQKIELGEVFQQHRQLLADVYTMSGSGAQAAEQLRAKHPELTDAQLEELAKLTVKATEEGHSQLSLLGQVDPAAVSVALLSAYGGPFQHRLDCLLLLRLQALQSRAGRSRTQNFVTGFDEKFVAYLGELCGAAPSANYRSKCAVYFLNAIEAFLAVEMASVDRWRRAIMPLHDCMPLLFNQELRTACPIVDTRLSSIGRHLALAETDRFMSGPACTFVRPMLAELLEKLRSEALLPRRQ